MDHCLKTRWPSVRVGRVGAWPNSGVLHPGGARADEPRGVGASGSAEFVPRTASKGEKKILQSKCKILSGAEHLVIPPKSMEKGLVRQPMV